MEVGATNNTTTNTYDVVDCDSVVVGGGDVGCAGVVFIVSDDESGKGLFVFQ